MLVFNQHFFDVNYLQLRVVLELFEARVPLVELSRELSRALSVALPLLLLVLLDVVCLEALLVVVSLCAIVFTSHSYKAKKYYLVLLLFFTRIIS